MIKKTASSLNQLISNLIVEELHRLGADTFFISPGSRSTPLTMALAEREKGIICLDERAAAFVASGYARATAKPAVLICTSGTAAANYFPAVIESYYDELAMIIITADRPPELHDVKANQTIKQQKLYGNHVHYFANLDTPDKDIPAVDYLEKIDKAFIKARNIPAGPVHLNFMFREPLAPIGEEVDFSDYLKPLDNWFENQKTFLETKIELPASDMEDINEVAGIINTSKKGIIICGNLSSNNKDAVLSLVEKTGWPVFPDIRSGLRVTCSHDLLIAYYDQILEHYKKIKAEGLTIIHLGGCVTSKRFLKFIKSADIKEYINISPSLTPFNPHHNLTKHITADLNDFCRQLEGMVRKNTDTDLSNELLDKNKAVAVVLNDYFESEALTEPAVARLISQNIRTDSALFLGSSMPIRDYDMFADLSGVAVPIAANRGVSGIDGSIASFFGFCHGHHKSGTALIGDLSLLHDLNSFSLLKNCDLSLTLVVINNNGGGIFSFLPVAQYQSIFENYFGTPHNLIFENIAQMFSLKYSAPVSKKEFLEDYKDSQSSKGATLIEISGDRQKNIEIHRELQSLIKTTLDNI